MFMRHPIKPQLITSLAQPGEVAGAGGAVPFARAPHGPFVKGAAEGPHDELFLPDGRRGQRRWWPPLRPRPGAQCAGTELDVLSSCLAKPPA